ncbi:hypothetical protein [Neobacillus sp. YIM B06451]|uniref:hypothetical protein n=1 Tax=Neobacillus sp. YIM B06451 TaxID=3070994 RepID=UPI00292DDD19|nr:hypothetical protein [Neobacillus sp. YIM B06451]
MSESRERQNVEISERQNVEVSEDQIQKIITKSQDKNENSSKIGHSGNSNVDVNVNIQIDTKAIAYALLCSSLARKEMTNEEFSFAIKKLEELMHKDQKKEPENRRRHLGPRRPLFGNF